MVQEVQGDLNKDDQTDHVFVIKGTDEAMVIQHEYLGELDRNRRGIIIVFGEGERYRLVLDNRDCFSSENEDGGVGIRSFFLNSRISLFTGSAALPKRAVPTKTGLGQNLLCRSV